MTGNPVGGPALALGEFVPPYTLRPPMSNRRCNQRAWPENYYLVKSESHTSVPAAT
jgi:hypothetical protein